MAETACCAGASCLQKTSVTLTFAAPGRPGQAAAAEQAARDLERGPEPADDLLLPAGGFGP